MKYALIFVAIVLSPVLASRLEVTEACGIQFLKEKGKLSSNFESAAGPAENCKDELLYFTQPLRDYFKESVHKTMPNESSCLVDEFDYRDVMDYLITIYVIRANKIFSESVLTVQLDFIRAQLRHELENIALDCEVDEEKLVSLFNSELGIRNETLEALQYDYCLIKFSVENKILEMENYEVNPYEISTDDINCTAIIDVDRNHTERKFADRLITTPETIAAKSCILQFYRDEKRYEWVAAFRVIVNITFVKKRIESDLKMVLDKLNDPSFFQLIDTCFSI